MQSVFLTDRGKVRTHNEDSGGIFKNRDDVLLAVVADGMGGHRAGDVASSMTVSLLEEEFNMTQGFPTPDEAETWFDKAIQKINRAIHDHSLSHPECEGMGTTIAAAICTEDFLTVANVGDSRAYILNESGFRQITEDHSLVQELVKSGEITQEDADHHPRKNVLLRAIGTQPDLKVDVKTIGWDEQNILILCSDGLSNKVSNEDMQQVLTGNGILHEKAEALIQMANHSGGEDNITLTLVELSAETESE